jgi:hypothetical protein
MHLLAALPVSPERASNPHQFLAYGEPCGHGTCRCCHTVGPARLRAGPFPTAPAKTFR